MAGIYGSSAEDRYFEGRLHQYLESIADRSEAIESKAEELLKDECNPWTPENLSEALCQVSDAKFKIVAACIASAIDAGLTNDTTNHLALAAMRHMVEEYWQGVANTLAERELDKGY